MVRDQQAASNAKVGPALPLVTGGSWKKSPVAMILCNDEVETREGEEGGEHTVSEADLNEDKAETDLDASKWFG